MNSNQFLQTHSVVKVKESVSADKEAAMNRTISAVRYTLWEKVCGHSAIIWKHRIV